MGDVVAEVPEDAGAVLRFVEENLLHVNRSSGRPTIEFNHDGDIYVQQGDDVLGAIRGALVRIAGWEGEYDDGQ